MKKLFMGLLALPWVWTFAETKPNVLFISIDDLNDYISPLDNHPGIKTPNFERLAGRSVTFANAHCASPACHSSRVAVMTGVHPVRSGIYRNMFGAHGPRWRHESKVLEKAVVLSQHFRDHGYWSAGGGKIFHTLQWTPGDSQNDPDAWDEYRGDPLDPISADWPRPESTKIDQNQGFVGKRPLGNHYFGAAVIEQEEETYGDHLVVDWAIERMKEKRDKPLFLAVGLFRPHIPFEVSQKWFDLYPMEKVQLPKFLDNDLEDARPHGRMSWHKWVTDNKQWKHLMRGYLASISYVDHQVGRLLDGLDSSGLKGNTIIVLWTDHGFHIGEKENWEKFALWDQTTRVPLFIHAPGMSADGRKSRQPVTLTDLYPTLCDLAGLPTPVQCSGVSLVPQLRNPDKRKKSLSLTSFQFWGDSAPAHAVSDDRHRCIRYPDGFVELYDLKSDPHEFTNLAADDKYFRIKNRLLTGMPKEVAEMAKIPKISPWNRQRGHRSGQAFTHANKPFVFSFEVKPSKSNSVGVIASCGGIVNGYSIYVKEGQLRFAIRRNNRLHEIGAPVPEEDFVVLVMLEASGGMSLEINGRLQSSGDAGGLIGVVPNEGSAIGRDDLTPVGRYSPPFAYQGEVRRIAR